MKPTPRPDCTCDCGHRHKSVTGSLPLEPCPFCGEAAQFESGPNDTWYVECSTYHCIAQGGARDERRTYSTPRLAAAAWNRICRAAKRRPPVADRRGLFPCPCGAPAEIDEDTPDDWGAPSVGCSDPDCPLDAYIREPWADEGELTFESIVEQWNTRASDYSPVSAASR